MTTSFNTTVATMAYKNQAYKDRKQGQGSYLPSAYVLENL
jgi:hypothetical protein